MEQRLPSLPLPPLRESSLTVKKEWEPTPAASLMDQQQAFGRRRKREMKVQGEREKSGGGGRGRKMRWRSEGREEGDGDEVDGW